MKNYSRISKFLEIPREVISNIPKITITGFDEILIENFKGILEYEDFFVRISTEIGIININGFNLKLNQMTDNDIEVAKSALSDWYANGCKPFSDYRFFSAGDDNKNSFC